MPVSRSSRSPARWVLYVVVALGLSTAVWYVGFRSKPTEKRPAQPAWAGNEFPPRIPVRTANAVVQDLPVQLKAIGTVTPVNTVTVRSRVSGELLSLGFEEGQQVEQGHVLAEIDPASFQIQLAQAEGQLRQNQARLNSARSDLQRIRELHGRKLVTDQELEVQQALVAEREGAVAADQARVDDARLKLAYTRIEAPISGRVGLRRIDPGNLVREGDTEGLVVITQTRPIQVTFTIPENELAAVLEPFRAGETLTVEAWDRTESNRLASGTLRIVDNQIDTATGTLRLKAEFPNQDDRLFPNQFVNVRLQVRTLKDAVIIPAAAVQFGSRGTYVYSVDAENKAVVRDIVLGPVTGDRQAVAKGLNAGDAVVLEGLDRLREGRTVVISNDPPPAPTAAAPRTASTSAP